jgi:hypothetical protein
VDSNWFFDIYDAYWNGSISMTLTPPSGSSCSKLTSQTINNTYFRIGAMNRTGNATYSRSTYDTVNDFYFRLGRNQIGSDYKCPSTPNKAFIGFESSNSNLENHVAWNLSGQQSWGHHIISGNLNSDKASYNNHFNYLLTTAEQKAGCPSHFQAFTLTKANNVTFSGTVAAAKADISWSFTDVITKWTVEGNFTGAAWTEGATLNVATSSPETFGEAKRVTSNETFWKKFGKIVIGVVVAVVVS